MEVKRIETNVEPKKIDFLGDGSFYYNYDIQAKIVTVSPMEGSSEEEEYEETRWNFIQVHLYGKPDYSACVRAIIRQFVDQDEEFDLINSANRVKLGLRSNTEDQQKYAEYLNLVDTIKATVKADLIV